MKFSFLIVQIRLGNAGIVQKWNCGPRGWNSILKMSLVALKHFPQPNLKQEGMWWRIKMLSFAKRESLWLMNLHGVKLYGCPPGGGNFPFNVKVNQLFLFGWVPAREPSADYSHGALPLWDTYRHADLFLFPSVCGHSARRKKKRC